MSSLRGAELSPAASMAAETAWKTLEIDYQTPPAPLKQLPDRMFTQQEIRDYYAKVANQAGAVADEARQFYTSYSDDPRAPKARDIYFDMLHAAVSLSSTSRVVELESATAERLKDPGLDDNARFQLSLRLLHSTVSGRQYEGDEAMRAELEKRSRQLALDYPNHPDGYRYLVNIALEAPPDKSEALAKEVLAGCTDPQIQQDCRGLINRSEAIGKPLSLALTLNDGKELHLTTLKNKVLILLFWDSTSKFSPKALWAVDQLYRSYHAKGVEAVGINFDEDKSSAASMLKNYVLTWPQYMDSSAGGPFKMRFGGAGLPMCWFVDKKGVLRELHGERDPVGILTRLLAE